MASTGSASIKSQKCWLSILLKLCLSKYSTLVVFAQLHQPLLLVGMQTLPFALSQVAAYDPSP